MSRQTKMGQNAGPVLALRRDDDGDLDDVVVEGVTMFRAEVMDDKTLWMACYFGENAAERLTFYVRASKGKLLFDTTEVPSEYRDWDAKGEPMSSGESSHPLPRKSYFANYCRACWLTLPNDTRPDGDPDKGARCDKCGQPAILRAEVWPLR